jgi:hypothetical protein
VNVAVPGVTNVAVNGDKVAVVAPGTTVAASKTGAVGEALLACLLAGFKPGWLACTAAAVLIPAAPPG